MSTICRDTTRAWERLADKWERERETETKILALIVLGQFEHVDVSLESVPCVWVCKCWDVRWRNCVLSVTPALFIITSLENTLNVLLGSESMFEFSRQHGTFCDVVCIVLCARSLLCMNEWGPALSLHLLVCVTQSTRKTCMDDVWSVEYRNETARRWAR